jgi:hypothetical protein
MSIKLFDESSSVPSQNKNDYFFSAPNTAIVFVIVMMMMMRWRIYIGINKD